MNILSVGGPDLVAAWRALGHNVFSVHHAPGADARLEHPLRRQRLLEILRSAGFRPDFLCYVDNGNFPMLLEPHETGCPNLFYSIDTYCNPWHLAFAHAFDKTLVAQKDFVSMFASENLDAEWLPLFCRRMSKEGGKRDIPVAFVGTIGHPNNPGREPFLRAFGELLPLHVESGDYVPIFGRSLIVLNQTAFGELNFRCFEAMGCGAALLMEKCDNGFMDLFSPGENILPPFTRGNAREATAIARIFLKNPDRLAEIARAGRKLIIEKHTDSARAARIVKLAEKLIRENAATRRQEERAERKRSVRSAFGIIAADLQGDKWREYRDFFVAMATEA